MRRSSGTILLLTVVVVLAALLAAGCGSSGTTTKDTTPVTQPKAEETTPSTAPSTTPQGGEKTFTLTELATYNGQNGMPAYIAVDGVVYDVSGGQQWSQGDHSPCNLDAMAGKDLTVILQSAPARMRGYVMALPVVGKLSGQ